MNLWHDFALGSFNPEDKLIGIDFNRLFLYPELAQTTWYHEVTHSILSHTTESGQAVEAFYQLDNLITKLSREDRISLRQTLYKSQILVQEGTASLMEILQLARMKTRAFAWQWAKTQMPSEYWERLNLLQFVFEYPSKYRDNFTNRIPHIAMQTNIRKDIVVYDLFNNPKKFIEYLNQDDNNPDTRYRKLISKIKDQKNLLNSSVEKICVASGISFYPPIQKKDVADYLNYLLSFTNIEYRYQESNITKLPEGIEVIKQASDNLIVANMNFNMKETGMMLDDINALLHYRDVIEGIMVQELGEEPTWKPELEQLLKRKIEGALLCFGKNPEKYFIGLDKKTISNLLNNELKEITLIIKWGLFTPGENNVARFKNSRRPDVVIYNKVSNLEDKFESWLNSGHSLEYIYVSAQEGHPFQTLILKDENNVIHLVNMYGNVKINDFINKYKQSLIKMDPKEFKINKKHINNALSIWMGLDWRIDWFSSMVSGEVVYR